MLPRQGKRIKKRTRPVPLLGAPDEISKDGVGYRGCRGVLRRDAGSRAAGHGHAGFTGRHHEPQRKATSAARSEVQRRDQERCAAVQALVGTARRSAEGRAERAAHHHRRRWLRRAQHLRRRDSDADDGPHRERGPALQPGLFHRALLAHARRADHRAQPPLGRLRRDLRAVDGLSRLQQHYRQGQGDDRAHPARQRLQHLMVRQGPQHARVRCQPGWALRPVADRHGLRVLLRLRRRRRQPVGAEPVPQHDADLSVPRQAAGHLEPCHRDGRRCHRLHDADTPDRPREADLHQVRARRHARAAPPDQGMGGQDQPDEALRRGLEQVARAHLREPETARRDSEGRQAAAVAEGRAEGVGRALGRGEEAVHPAGRGVRRLRRLQRPRDRPRDPGARGTGQARQHAHHLHQW